MKFLLNKKNLLLFTLIFGGFFTVLTVIALSSPYSPGATLNPSCSPGETNCTVESPATSGDNSNITSLDGLTELTVTGSSYLGDKDEGNYAEFNENGTLQLYGDAAVWDDLTIPVTATNSMGSDSPTFGLLQDSEETTSGYAINLDGSSQYGTISDHTSFDFPNDFSIEMWIKPDLDMAEWTFMLAKEDLFAIRRRNDNNMYFRLWMNGGNDYRLNVNDVLNLGQKNHIVATVDVDSGNTTVNLYVNDSLIGNQTYYGEVPNSSSSTGNIIVGAGSGLSNKFQGDIDELRIYNKTLDSTEISSHYNAGQGETGTDEANLVAGYNFDDGSGTTFADYGPNSLDGALTGSPSWASGLVSSTDASRGVYTWYFEDDSQEELHFTVQLPHKWKIGTNLRPHVHWVPSDDSSGDVVWALEYTASDINGTFGSTTTINNADTAEGELNHQVSGLGDEIDMSSYTEDTDVSAMIIGRIYRDGTDSEDTYTSAAGLLEIDFHYQIDTLGSSQEYSK